MATMTETVTGSAAAMRDGLTSFFSRGADLASNVGSSIGETSADLLRSLEKSVKRNPMMAIGVAFAGGQLLGGVAIFLMRRGRSRRVDRADQSAS